MNSKQKFISIDLETSGLDDEKDSIIEVGLVLFDLGQEIERFSSLVFYDKKLAPIVKRITNINESELKIAPRWEEVKTKIESYINDDVIVVGHNIEFDLGFLKKGGLDLTKYKQIDSWYLASLLIFNVKSYSLEYLLRMIRWEYNAHRALDDAIAVKVLLEYLFLLVKKIPNKTREKIKRLFDKGKWSYQFVFDFLWEDNIVEKGRDFVMPKYRNDVVSENTRRGKWFIENTFIELKKHLQRKNEILVLSQNVFDKLQKENFIEMNYFDSRENYICRSKLKNILKKNVLDNEEIGFLVKILIRVSNGYWNGLIKQINLSSKENNKRDLFGCDGSICMGDCYFDNRLDSMILKKIGVIGTYAFAIENYKKMNYDNLFIWSENILLEDGISGITSQYYNLDYLMKKLVENKEDEIEISKRKKIEELYKKVQVLNNGIQLMVLSKANKTDYGSFLDITPLKKNEASFISIVRQSRAIIDSIDDEIASVVDEIKRLCIAMVDNNDYIIKIWLDTRDQMKISVFAKVFESALLNEFESKNIILSSRSIAENEDYYGKKYFAEGYKFDLKSFEPRLEDVENNTNEVGLDIEYFAEKEYNLAVFSSKKKVDEYYEYYKNKASEKNLILFREKKKFIDANLEKGIVLCAYSELGQLQLEKDNFDFIYLNDLMFDVPGEVITTTRSMMYEDESFLKYALPRMILRFRFVITLLNASGRMAVGDKRFYHKSYGQTLRDKLNISWK